ncbi:hypothetical protein AB6F62_16620 [Providencia huaxiensis]|uniref:hypothetical protein n=1 Tax=Providencia huaxiensis TaxID=2027290 RepID=UPI0034DD461A
MSAEGEIEISEALNILRDYRRKARAAGSWRGIKPLGFFCVCQVLAMKNEMNHSVIN